MWRFVQYNITFSSVDFAMQAGFKLGLPVSNHVWYLVILIILQFRMCTRKNFDVLNFAGLKSNLIPGRVLQFEKRVQRVFQTQTRLFNHV